MSEELKPCPYCHGEPHVIMFQSLAIVQCRECEMYGPRTAKAKDAIAAWNALPRCLRWTKEKPTQDGFYWCRFRHPNVMIRWFAMVLVNAKGRYGVTVGSSDIHDIDSYDDAEWAGPIPEPEE